MPKTHIPFSLKGETLTLLEGHIKPRKFFQLIETRGARNEVVFWWAIQATCFPIGSTHASQKRGDSSKKWPSPPHSLHLSSPSLPGLTGCQHNQLNSRHFLHQTGFPSSMTLCNLYPPLLIPPFPEATKHPLSAFLALDTSEPIEMNRIQCSVWQRGEKREGWRKKFKK